MANSRMPRRQANFAFSPQPHRIIMIAHQNRHFILGGEPSSNIKTLCAVFGFVCVVLAFVSVANSQTLGQSDAGSSSSSQVVGFTEPYKQIKLSSDELGSIAEMFVAEGDFVTANTPIAKLDARVQELQLRIATQVASTKSELLGAERILEKRRTILNRLRQLQANGHAGDAEIIRAEMEFSIAEAQLMSAKEDSVVREIEMQRAEMQLQRRSILAPFDGVVSEIHRDKGEYLSPLNPEVVTIVQIDRLFATFNVPSSQVSSFRVGTTHQVELANGSYVDAVVEKVGVVTDAQSGTVVIKLVIENVDGNIRSGESVVLNI